MKKVYRHGSRIFWEYRIICSDFLNQYFENNPWHIKEYWALFVGFNNKWFDFEDFYYDGHTSKSITLLGITVGKTYSYESKSVKEWNELKGVSNV